MPIKQKKIPPIYQELVDAIGIEATDKLCKLFGGWRINIPQSVDEAHWLSLAIGFEAATKLCDDFTFGGSTQIILPKWKFTAREKRHQMIDELVAKGASLNEMVTALDISYSTVEYHVKQARKRLSKEV